MSSVVITPPLSGSPRVTSPFGPRVLNGQSGYHKGIDFGVPEGTPIYAAAEGIVVEARAQNSNLLGEGYGYFAVLDHGGFYTVYAHMHVNPTRYVSVGQRVVPGQQIGIVGSTGRSTGNHLHFEVRLGSAGWGSATAVDPMSHLDGSPLDTTGLPSSFDSTEKEYVDRIPYTPSQVVGRRVSSLTAQPLHAYVNIYIGDKLLTTNPAKPNTIQSFEITRLEGTGDEATFTLFDDNWEEIERTFAAHWRDVHLQYGYVDSDMVSERFNMMLSNYSISFNSTGVILNVSAIATGTVSNLPLMTLATGTKNPSEAVKAICRNIPGLIVEDQNFDESVDASEEYTLINDYPIAYIQDKIVGNGAITPDGEVLRFNIGPDNRVYFKKYTFSTVTSDQRSIKTYIYQKGYDSVVQDITFDIKGVFGGTTAYGAASELQSSVIDPTTKEISTHRENTQSVVTSATGEFQSISATQSTALEDPAGYNASQMNNKLYYSVKRKMTEHYEAQMTIVGDPTIKLLDDVRVINMTDSGELHHTSGIYMVTGIVDNIDNGVMTTSLKLIRNGSINEGVELINPKTLIK